MRTIFREIWVVLTGTYRDCLQGLIGTDYRDILGLYSDILELSNKDVLALSPGTY
jgi:hypothetical protein